MRRPVWRILLQFWMQEWGLSVFLFLLVLFMFLLPPVLPAGPFGRFVADFVFSLLLIAGVAAASERRSVFVAASALAVAALVLRWTNWLLPAVDVSQWRAASKLATFALLTVVVLAQVFRRGRVTLHRIQGAVAAYLLLGLVWASSYEWMALRHPGAFSGAVSDGDDTLQGWLYFSLVTLTTMGYGDITPVHPAARSLAVLEGLTGQLYPAILLARLVSLEVMVRREDT